MVGGGIFRICSNRDTFGVGEKPLDIGTYRRALFPGGCHFCFPEVPFGTTLHHPVASLKVWWKNNNNNSVCSWNGGKNGKLWGTLFGSALIGFEPPNILRLGNIQISA